MIIGYLVSISDKQYLEDQIQKIKRYTADRTSFRLFRWALLGAGCAAKERVYTMKKNIILLPLILQLSACCEEYCEGVCWYNKYKEAICMAKCIEAGNPEELCDFSYDESYGSSSGTTYNDYPTTTLDNSNTDGSSTSGVVTSTSSTSTTSTSSSGNDNSTTSSSTGSIGFCGDGIIQENEECDDAGQSEACNIDCTISSCTDGKMNEISTEECDDGNLLRGDGCSPDCLHEYIMFVTKEVFPADFNTVTTADSLCNSHKGQLPGTYIAWISPREETISDFLPFGEPLLRRDGKEIVSSAEELFSGVLQQPINLSADMSLVEGYTWTGTLPNGEIAGTKHCSEWTEAIPGFVAVVGLTSSNDANWTDSSFINPSDSNSCTKSNHIYCFRQFVP